MTASVLKQDPNTLKKKNQKNTYFIMTQTHNLQILGVIPFIKRQKDT